MQNWEERDRRKFVRFPVCICLKCQCPEPSHEVPSKTHDISIKGIGVLTSERFSEGSPLDLLLSMPDNGEEIQAKGKVVWQDQNGTGPNMYRVGIFLEEAGLKPIPLVLRTMQARSQ